MPAILEKGILRNTAVLPNEPRTPLFSAEPLAVAASSQRNWSLPIRPVMSARRPFAKRTGTDHSKFSAMRHYLSRPELKANFTKRNIYDEPRIVSQAARHPRE